MNIEMINIFKEKLPYLSNKEKKAIVIEFNRAQESLIEDES